jgi:hypothetical protein
MRKTYTQRINLDDFGEYVARHHGVRMYKTCRLYRRPLRLVLYTDIKSGEFRISGHILIDAIRDFAGLGGMAIRDIGVNEGEIVVEIAHSLDEEWEPTRRDIIAMIVLLIITLSSLLAVFYA